jgi:hypothetical protein
MFSHDMYNEVLIFLEKSLRETVTSFIPKEEIKLLPPYYLETKSPVVFYDYIFAIEKFLNTHIFPHHYAPLYSSVMLQVLKDDTLKRKVQRILKYFRDGDKRINDKSVKILPRSSYRYFKSSFNKTKNRYVMDYVCDAYGIRHTHLLSPNDDCLLFYVLINHNIILLSIGTHKDIYENNNLRILIHEFSDFIQLLGIYETGIDPGIEQTGEETKKMWEMSANVLPSIDGKTYTISTASMRSFSGISFDVMSVFQEICYQINSSIISITKNLDKEYNLYIKKSTSKLTLDQGYIVIGDRVSRKEWGVVIDFFKRYQLIKMMS